MMILINCTGKFCYGLGTEAATGGVFKSFIKFTVKHLCQSPLFNIVACLGPTILLKRDSDKGAFL